MKIAKELNTVNNPKNEWSVIGLIGAMIVMGTIIMFSLITDQASVMTLEEFLKPYMKYTVTGIGIGVLCYFMNYAWLEEYSRNIFIGALFYMILARILFPPDPYGMPYRVTGIFVFSRTILMLPIFIISFAGVLKDWANGYIINMIKVLVVFASVVYLYLIESHVDLAFLLSCSFLSMITAAIFNKRFKGKRLTFILSIYGGVIPAIFLLLRISSPYHLSQIVKFLNPKLGSNTTEHIYKSIENLLSNAKFIGKSNYMYTAVNDAQRFVLSYHYSQFTFIYVISAFGWIAAFLITVVLAVLITRMALSIRSLGSEYGKYVSIGVVSFFTLQVVSNIFMNLGLFSLRGFPLPFVSFEGGYFIINMSLLGLFVGIYRSKDLTP